MSMITSSTTVVVICAILARWSISLGHYSGEGKGPMYGDYEAQRHWMEVTVNLPIHQWYENTTKNDLQYWGLDYPPLTAYHSYVCGIVGGWVNAGWVSLGKSRGYESYDHKLFMRTTVLVADLLIYIPAVVCFILLHMKLTNSHKVLVCVTCLLYPGLMLIDHGHFQYNCVSLGLLIWAVLAISRNHDLIGSALFSLSINYKQMQLYHAIPFFLFLFGKSFRSKQGWRIVKLIKLALVVIATFAVCWLPFLRNEQTATQVLTRLFPFERGLYEDKVANVWCSLSIIIKIKQLVSNQLLVKLCLISTVVTLAPSSLDLLLSPSLRKFKVALVNSSLVFFLFSFQVHEKSILIAAISACLVLDESPLAVLWLLIISTFSLLPLVIKDGQTTAFCASSVMFIVLALRFHQPFSQPYFTKRSTLRRLATLAVSV